MPRSTSWWQSPVHWSAGERLSVLVVKVNHLVDSDTQLLKNRQFVVAMAAAIKQSRTAADETLILLGPLDYLYVARALFHLVASAIAALTAFSSYFTASSPAFPEIVTWPCHAWMCELRWLPLPPQLPKPWFSNSAINSRTFLDIRSRSLYCSFGVAFRTQPLVCREH